ncbi:unnamed protein product [Brachionus calyciflorus]|uniref:Uncharacterized protein n=1 Tax=Brachionus calyciflorus TaxID=104777 RepID=A0A813U727_9BILA|nr:unnamed protein product [Brachionus calyciflorus]
MSNKHPTRPMGTHGSGGQTSQHGAADWSCQYRHGHVKVDGHPKPTPSDEKQYKDLPAAEVYHDVLSKHPEEHHKKVHLHKTTDEHQTR